MQGEEIIVVIPWEEWWELALKDDSNPQIALLPLHPEIRTKKTRLQVYKLLTYLQYGVLMAKWYSRILLKPQKILTTNISLVLEGKDLEFLMSLAMDRGKGFITKITKTLSPPFTHIGRGELFSGLCCRFYRF